MHTNNNWLGACHMLTCWFFWNYFFDPEDGGDVPSKRRLQLNRLQWVISQKMILFITTVV
jgi:hypothetical protein